MTTLTATRTRSGNTVHLALANSAVTVCGSKVVATLPGEVATCGRCQRTAAKIAARETTQAAPVVPEGVPAVVLSAEPFTAQLQVEAAAKRTAPAAATRQEVTVTVPAPARFAAVRQNGRYRVVTIGVGAAAPGRVVATCASRAKAEEKAAKLNADLSADLAAAPAVVADQVAALADSVRDGDVSFTDAVGTLLGTPVAPAVRKGPAPEVVAEAVKQFQAELDAVAPALGKVMSEPLPGEKLVNVYVGASVAELIIPRTDDADAAIASVAAKLADRQPNAQNYRHVKLSAAERGALAGVATAIENDATTAGQGLLARAARTLRTRIAATD